MRRPLAAWLLCAWLAFVLVLTFMEARVQNADLRTANGTIEAQVYEIQALKQSLRECGARP